MTTEQAMRHLFPAELHKAAKNEARKIREGKLARMTTTAKTPIADERERSVTTASEMMDEADRLDEISAALRLAAAALLAE